MAQIIKPINVDVAKENTYVYILAKQGDAQSRYLEITILNEGATVDITGATRAILRAVKPDNTVTVTDGSITNGKVKVELTKQTLAIDGPVHCFLSVVVGESILSTLDFTVRVEPTNVDEDKIVSSDEYTAFQQALIDMGDIQTLKLEVEAAKTDAAESANLAQAALDDMNDRLPVGTDDIQDEAITTAKIETGAVTTEKLDASAVTSEKIASGAITSDKLGSGAVSTAKIDTSAVTPEKTSFVTVSEWTARGATGNIDFTMGSSESVPVVGGESYLLLENYPLANPSAVVLVLTDDKGNTLEQIPVDALADVTTNDEIYSHGLLVQVPLACTHMYMTLVAPDDNPDISMEVHYSVCKLQAVLGITGLRIETDQLSNDCVTSDKLSVGSVTLSKLSDDVTNMLSGALKREIVPALPSTDGSVLAMRTLPYTGRNMTNSNLITTNWISLDAVSDLSPVTDAKRIKMTVTLTSTDGQIAVYSGGEIRLRYHGADGNKMTCPLSGISWQEGDNQLDIPLTRFTPANSPSWSNIDEITVFTYGANQAGSYSITVSDLRIVDASVGIDPHTIYLVPSAVPETENVYNEYMYINYQWEQIGSTAVDLSGYYTKAESDDKLSEKVNVYDLVNGMYTVPDAQYAVHSNDAATDRLGNIIEETYATKDEIIELQEQISEVANQTEESGQTAQEAKGIAEKALSVAIKGGLSSVSLWSDVPDILRKGMGSSVFQTGYEFETLDSDTGNTLVWAVRDHNKQAAADSNLDYTMTLELKHVYSNANGMYLPLQFDAPEALYYAADGLPAGTYHVTVAQASYTNDNGKTFQFTLATDVPSGGQIVLNATYNTTLEGQSVQTYASPSDTTVIETATLTEGSEGTSLGTTDGNGNMNHMHRIAYGSNNYAQSAVRQWLNSAAAAGSVWTPTNKFDRAPSWATTYNGFMHGLPEDFLAVVQPAIVPCRTNSVYECASLDGTAFATDQVYNMTDKFFILSRPEIYGTYDSTTHKDGEQLEYYAGLTNTEIIKYDVAGTARNCWLRSPAVGYAGRTRITSTDGSMGGVSVYNNNGIAPACIIA